jgi:hypothetical protein
MQSRYERKRKRRRKIQYLCSIIFGICVLGGTILFILHDNNTTDIPKETSEPTISMAAPSSVSTSTLPPSPTPSEEPSPRYGFTDEDIYLLAQVLCGSKYTDGDGEYDIDFAAEVNYCEISKVLGVIMNRVRSELYPNTVYEVVNQEGQFAVIPANLYKEPSDIALETVGDWCKAYDEYDIGVQSIPEDHLYFSGDGITNTTRKN